MQHTVTIVGKCNANECLGRLTIECGTDLCIKLESKAIAGKYVFDTRTGKPWCMMHLGNDLVNVMLDGDATDFAMLDAQLRSDKLMAFVHMLQDAQAYVQTFLKVWQSSKEEAFEHALQEMDRNSKWQVA